MKMAVIIIGINSKSLAEFTNVGFNPFGDCVYFKQWFMKIISSWE